MNDLLVDTIRKNAVKKGIYKVLVALSGGPDSIALAFALYKAGIQIMALHCNFHLRADESDRDQKFVENFCKSLQIPLEVRHFDVFEYIKTKKSKSVEMACRDLRYDWFLKLLSESEFQRVAVGHNADDNIETFFINALRGSGTRGLKGIIDDNGEIWRPLLDFHRKDILKFLADNNLDFILDSSNLESDFRRNFLRNKIIPLLKSEWKGFDKAMDKTLCNLREENRVVEMSIDSVCPENTLTLSVEEIMRFPAPQLLVLRFIQKAGPFSTTASEVLEAIRADKPRHKTWHLRKGLLTLTKNKLFIEMSHGE